MTAPRKRPEVPVPENMESLPLTDKGYLKPWFVKADDFRVMDGNKAWLAVTKKNCWVCGNGFKPNEFALVGDAIGAMVRICREPPCHLECATYALQVCPFLLYPNAKRRPQGLEKEQTLQYRNEKMQIKDYDHNPGKYFLTVVRDFVCVHADQLLFYKESDVLDRQYWIGGEKQDSIPDPIYPLEDLSEEFKKIYNQTNR